MEQAIEKQTKSGAAKRQARYRDRQRSRIDQLQEQVDLLAQFVFAAVEQQKGGERKGTDR